MLIFFPEWTLCALHSAQDQMASPLGHFLLSLLFAVRVDTCMGRVWWALIRQCFLPPTPLRYKHSHEGRSFEENKNGRITLFKKDVISPWQCPTAFHFFSFNHAVILKRYNLKQSKSLNNFFFFLQLPFSERFAHKMRIFRFPRQMNLVCLGRSPW